MQSHDLRKQEYAVKKAATCLSSAPVSLGACFFRVGVPYSTNIENFRLTRKSGHSTTATQMVTSVSFFCLLSFSCIHVFFKEAKYRKSSYVYLPSCLCLYEMTHTRAAVKVFKLNLSLWSRGASSLQLLFRLISSAHIREASYSTAVLGP